MIAVTAEHPPTGDWQLVVFAEHQPEYLPLSAWKLIGDSYGEVITCWRPSLRERLAILFRGRIFLSLLTFNKPLSPIRFAVDVTELDRREEPV